MHEALLTTFFVSPIVSAAPVVTDCVPVDATDYCSRGPYVV